MQDDIIEHSPYVRVLKGSCYHKVEDPAFKFPFELDHFQNHSNYCISRDENVLVLAHTGSGKTAVAKYAIAHYLRKKKKVVYTSPIKALSNQKYKELKELFEGSFAKELGRPISVGIMTGDNKIQPDADIVIMTTEILRNALYNIGEKDKTKKDDFFEESFLDQIGCVIFDEVHYINDKDRGHVWEETIIMLDPKITLVMLSATIDKAEQFADWIGNNKKKIVNLTPTNHRVVPLEHFIYTTDKLYKIQDYKEVFHDDIYDIASVICKKAQDSRKKPGNLYLVNELVDYMKKKKLLQAIFFSFSRKNCERYAKRVLTQLVTLEESIEITKLFSLYMHKYEEQYSKFPQYNTLKDLISRGIAFHHSGLLPIMKEVVELIFQKGLIKVLFATETFAVGVNMPTRTIVFTEVEKYTNEGRRFLQTAEYKQMSGRAGRRGLDKIGNVILLPLYEFPDKKSLKSVMLGKLPHIQSKFSPTYGFLLKIIQSDSNTMSGFVKSSMFQVDNDQEIKQNSNNIITLEQKCKDVNLDYSEEQLEVLNELFKYEMLEKKYLSMGITLNKKQLKEKTKLKKKVSHQLDYENNYNEYSKYLDLQQQLLVAKSRITKAEHFIFNESNKLTQVLIDTGYLIKSDKQPNGMTSEDVTSKAVLAAQINECNPLVLSEMVVQGLFDDLDSIEICALLAIFVDDVKSDNRKNFKSCNFPSNRIKSRISKVCDIINNFIEIEQKHGVDCHKYEYYNIYYEYIQVAHMWASGSSFSDILNTVDTYEGNFIKSILKINSLAHDVACLSKIHGNLKVLPYFEDIEDLLVRNLVSINSLYL